MLSIALTQCSAQTLLVWTQTSQLAPLPVIKLVYTLAELTGTVWTSPNVCVLHASHACIPTELYDTIPPWHGLKFLPCSAVLLSLSMPASNDSYKL